MPYRPTADNGAVYPACPSCGDDTHPVFFIDQTVAREVPIPNILCAACIALNNVEAVEEFPWPPVG